VGKHSRRQTSGRAPRLDPIWHAWRRRNVSIHVVVLGICIAAAVAGTVAANPIQREELPADHPRTAQERKPQPSPRGENPPIELLQPPPAAAEGALPASIAGRPMVELPAQRAPEVVALQLPALARELGLSLAAIKTTVVGTEGSGRRDRLMLISISASGKAGSDIAAALSAVLDQPRQPLDAEASTVGMIGPYVVVDATSSLTLIVTESQSMAREALQSIGALGR
jgi:hypothetical protein